MNSPSRLRSLRWQLPLSYAGIALLAVLALGVALIGTLRSYYRQQERLYLRDNAMAIADELAPLMAAGDPPALEPRISGYAFLIQTRIQILDELDNEIIADSGQVDFISPAIAVSTEEEFNLFETLGSVTEEVVIVVEEDENIEGNEISSQRTITRTSRLPAQGSLFGFNLGRETGSGGVLSDLVVDVPIVDSSVGVLGWVRLLQGPAYGREIIDSVALGWFIAGSAAVLLAAVAGWLVSRRLTKPLLALTAVTSRMADGDLGARANVHRMDELGLLGSSFNRMADQVEGTVLSLRQFTADAAHELHTPLTALQTDLQLIEDSNDPEQKQRVSRAREQAQRLQDLSDSLLELSMLEAESSMERLEAVDLTGLVQQIGEIYASQAEQVNLSFMMTLPEKPIFVIGDETQLQRALMNILDNSIKFTPAPGRISLSLSQNGNDACILVQDTGIGIVKEDLDMLFSRFHRGRNTVDYPGSGLGLAIVQEIINRHQGQVSIASGDWGTELKLLFPLKE